MTKQFDPGIKKQYLVSWVEDLGLQPLIMPSLGPFFVDRGTMISFVSPFLQFRDLTLPVLSGYFQIHVPFPDSPVRSMLQLYG